MMKTKLFLYLMVFVSALGVSCDGPGEADPQDPDSFAPLESTIILGEVFTFTDVNLVAAEKNLENLRFTGDNEAEVGSGLVYEYFRTSLRTATITLQFDPAEALDRAVRVILSGDIGVALSVELRQILNSSNDGTFTAEQIARIAEILNVAGAGLSISPDDPTQLVTDTNIQYIIAATSSSLDKFRGIIGGNYSLSGVAREVAFSETFLEGDETVIPVWIPFATTTTTDVQLREEGTFVLELVNDTSLP
jgi:hypothetical protein